MTKIEWLKLRNLTLWCNWWFNVALGKLGQPGKWARARIRDETSDWLRSRTWLHVPRT